MKNSLIRKMHHEEAKEANSSRAWRNAGEHLGDILQLYRAYKNAERSGNNDRIEIIEQRCQEKPIGHFVRSGWSDPFDATAEEFKIELSFGGPSAMIRGELDHYEQAINPKLYYQDWGTPWTEFRLMNEVEREALQWFCLQFYFGD